MNMDGFFFFLGLHEELDKDVWRFPFAHISASKQSTPLL